MVRFLIVSYIAVYLFSFHFIATPSSIHLRISQRMHRAIRNITCVARRTCTQRIHSQTLPWTVPPCTLTSFKRWNTTGCSSTSCQCRSASSSNNSNMNGGGCGSAGCACASRTMSTSNGNASNSSPPLSAPTAEQQSSLAALNAEVNRLYQLGEYESALAVSVSSVEMAQKLFGMEHPAYASALNNAALLHKVHRQDYAAATQLYQRALDAYAVSVGENHISYLTTLNNLALACRAQGQLQEAEEHLTHAVAAHRRAAATATVTASPSTVTPATVVGEKGSLPLASALLSLGGVLSERGKYPAAIELQEEALLICRRRFGEEHPSTATALNNLSLTHKRAGQLDIALTHCQRALNIRARNLPPAHPDILVSLNNIAELLRSMGQEDKAISVQQKIIDIIESQEQERKQHEQQQQTGEGTQPLQQKEASWQRTHSSNAGGADAAAPKLP
jgi:tetratricopeptide (TPR) repeat protein